MVRGQRNERAEGIEAGDDFVVVKDERLAKQVASERQAKRRETRLGKTAMRSLEDVISTMGQGEGQRVLNLVVKADVQGSVEALRDSLTNISTADIRVNVINPGPAETPMLEEFGFAADGEQALANLGSALPLGHAVTPEDIAAAAVYLASEEARSVTGITLNVDAGRDL